GPHHLSCMTGFFQQFAVALGSAHGGNRGGNCFTQSLNETNDMLRIRIERSQFDNPENILIDFQRYDEKRCWTAFTQTGCNAHVFFRYGSKVSRLFFEKSLSEYAFAELYLTGLVLLHIKGKERHKLQVGFTFDVVVQEIQAALVRSGIRGKR